MYTISALYQIINLINEFMLKLVKTLNIKWDLLFYTEKNNMLYLLNKIVSTYYKQYY